MKDNKIIAEFMGYDISTSLRDGVECVEYAEDNIRALSDTHYHNSWDWLMPVISKCLEVGGDISVERIYHSLHTQDLSFAYKEVVEFIKEHNSKDFDWC